MDRLVLVREDTQQGEEGARVKTTKQEDNMRTKIIYLLFFAAGFQACFYRGQEYVNVPFKDKPDYVDVPDSNGFINEGLYNHDKVWGFDTDAAAKYRLARTGVSKMRYDLLKAENWHLNIYDTLSFYFDFGHPDSSYYIFSDSEYDKVLKKRKRIKSKIPLTYKSSLEGIKDCEGCVIYKYESSYMGKCLDWFISDSIGFLKAYGSYDDLETNINDWEIKFLLGTPKYYYSKKLLQAIKADKQFHTRCTPGTLW